MGIASGFGLKADPYIENVSRHFLLIDDEFLNDSFDSDYGRFAKYIPKGVDTSIASMDSLVCRNLCLINLAVGLTEFVRKLLGLPVSYHPFEESQR